MEVLCQADVCPIILNSACVFYEGDTLVYTGIVNNDNLQTALQKIDAKFQDAGLGYVFTNGVIQSAPGDPVKLGGSLIENTVIVSGGYTFKITDSIESAAFITTGGTSSDFVKGDGSLDATSYQPAGPYLTGLSGDGTASGPGIGVFTLDSVNSNPGVYGNATHVPVITVDSKGRATSITTTLISVPSGILSFVGDVTGTGVTGSPTTLTLATVNSNIYGTNTPLKFAVNDKGLVTSAAPITPLDLAGILGYTPVPDYRTITINGVTQNLANDRTWTIPVGSGTVTSVGVSAGTGISASVTNPTTTPLISIINTAPDQVVSITGVGGVTVSGSYPNFTISVSGGGTVTNVAALTIGTSGTDISSTVANPTTTPVITLNIPTASASNRGALSPSDWTFFNNKQEVISLTTTGTSGAATFIGNTLNIPQYQAAGNYITDLNGEATASGPGVASVTLSNTAVIGKVLTGLNITGGTILSTDSILAAFGKVQNQINGLIGATIYKGVWNASTNTPALASSVGTQGWYYVVNVPGSTNLNGITDWQLGDWAIFNGSVWQKVDNTDAVVSVNGYTGAVSLVTTDIPEGTNLYYTDLRARQSIALTTTGSSGAATYNNTTGALNIPQYTLAGLGGITLSSLSAGTGISYNNLTGVITNSAPDQIVGLSAGTGIGITGSYPNFTITNSAPDQTVVLTAGSGISITGTYPNFTIASSLVGTFWSLASGGALTGNNTISGAFSATFTLNNISITQNALSSAWQSALKVTAGAHTGMTASTEFVSNDFVGASQTWLTGSILTQRWTYFRSFTANFPSGSTISNAYTVYIDGPTLGSNATYNLPAALGLNGNLALTSGNSIVMLTGSTNSGSSFIKFSASTPTSTVLGANFNGFEARSAGGYSATDLYYFSYYNSVSTQHFKLDAALQTSIFNAKTYVQNTFVVGPVSGGNSNSTLYLSQTTGLTTTGPSAISSIAQGAFSYGLRLEFLVAAPGSQSAVTGDRAFSLFHATKNALVGTGTTDGARLYVVQDALTSGFVPALKVNAGAHTSMTASTEFVSNDFTGATQTWAAGNIATQRWNYFRAYTAAFASSSAITDAYTVYIEPPVAGTNAGITNPYALGVVGQVKIAQNTGNPLLTVNNQNSASNAILNLYTSGAYSMLYGGQGLILNGYGAVGAFGAPSVAGANILRIVGGALTAMTASTELVDVDFQLARTVTWATGNITTQRFVKIGGPTIAFAVASTVTNAYTVYIDKPVAGTNATITNNYALGLGGALLLSDTNTITLNAFSGIMNWSAGANFQTQGSTRMQLFATGGMVVSQSSGILSGWNPILTVNPGGHLQLTASTEFTNFSISAVTQQWSTGALTTQRFNWIKAPTISFVAASTATDVYNLYIDAPIAGTNATITNPYALGVAGKVSISGSWTANANLQAHAVFGGSPTSRNTNNDTLYGYLINPTMTLNAGAPTGQVAYAVSIKPTFSGAFASTWALELGGNLQLSGATTKQIQIIGATNQLNINVGSNQWQLLNAAGYGVSGTTSNLQINSQGSIYFYSQNVTANQFFFGDQTQNATTARIFATIVGAVPSVSTAYAPTTGTSGLIQIGASNGLANFQPTSGTATHTTLTLNDVINQTGTASGAITDIRIISSLTNVLGIKVGVDYSPAGTYSGTGAHYSFRSTSGSVLFTQDARSAGWTSAFKVVAGAHTSLTTLTEFISNDFTGATQTWAAGNFTTQRFTYFRGFTMAFASATTVTDVYNVYIDKTTAGTNATITNNWALGLGGSLKVVGSTTGTFFPIFLLQDSGSNDRFKVIDTGATSISNTGLSQIGLTITTSSGSVSINNNSARIESTAVNGFIWTSNSVELFRGAAGGATAMEFNLTKTNNYQSIFYSGNTNLATATNYATGSYTMAGTAAIFTTEGQNRSAIGVSLRSTINTGISVSNQILGGTGYNNSFDGHFVDIAYTGPSQTLAASATKSMIRMTKFYTTPGTFDHTGAYIEMANLTAFTGDFIKAWDGTNIKFKVTYTGDTTVNTLSTGNITISDGANIITGSTTGTILGSVSTQKLAFWGATPIVQPTTGVTAATRVSVAGNTVTDADTFDGYTIGKVVKALRNAGLLA